MRCHGSWNPPPYLGLVDVSMELICLGVHWVSSTLSLSSTDRHPRISRWSSTLASELSRSSGKFVDSPRCRCNGSERHGFQRRHTGRVQRSVHDNGGGEQSVQASNATTSRATNPKFNPSQNYPPFASGWSEGGGC